MSEETKVEGIESPFDKEAAPTVAAEPATAEAGTEEVAPTEAATESSTEASTQAPTEAVSAEADTAETVSEAGAETPASRDYSQYAEMAETPTANEYRKFDYVAVSGKVDTEVITTDAGDVEKRKPATAVKLFLTQDRGENDRPKSEELTLPLTVVPIKYRMVMEQRAGSQGEILVLKTSEFDGKTTDTVTVTRYSPDGKAVETSAPMTVLEARKKYLDTEGKQALRDKVHLYSLVGGELVRFVVKGTGLWEKEDDLHKGKTPASQAKYPFLSKYLSEFAINDPYFLYEMKVDAAYRDHGTIKYYRPTFTKGTRISAEVEDQVIEHLEDLHKYFKEMNEAVKASVATKSVTEEAAAEPTETVPFGAEADPDGDY